MPILQNDLITAAISFTLTVMVLSYLIGDNFFFRVAIHIFIGVSAAYVGVVAFYQVIMPHLIVPLLAGSTSERLAVIVPVILSALLLTKLFPRLSRLGNPATAYLVGIGAAVAILGALSGTLAPQITASISQFDVAHYTARGLNPAEGLTRGIIVLLGTVSTLAYFHFRVNKKASNRSGLVRLLAFSGQVFIGITLGALFAGVFASALTALIERLEFIILFLLSLVS